MGRGRRRKYWTRRLLYWNFVPVTSGFVFTLISCYRPWSATQTLIYFSSEHNCVDVSGHSVFEDVGPSRTHSGTGFGVGQGLSVV